MKDDKTLQNIEKYQKHYSEPKLFAKISRIFRKAGIKGVYYALLLYHVVTDPGTPARQKAIILGALGYFILPMDMIPDLMPLVGFTDDIAALTACLKAVYDNVTPSVKSKAARKLLDWFPDADISKLVITRTILTIFAILGVCTANAQNDSKIPSKDPSSITFTVDEGLSLPEDHFSFPVDANHIYYSSLEYCGVDYDNGYSLDDSFSSKDHRLRQSRFTGENIYGNSHQVMFSMFIRAYAEHRPVVLSPDAIWLLISQSFSYHVNRDSEALRSKIVDHKDKKTLTIRSFTDLMGEEADWATIADMFANAIISNTKGDIAETLIADFTTTGETERMVSQITLMNSMKSYFDYEAIWAICGIPSVTLTGTPEDWKEVLAKTQKLGNYGLRWWTKKLIPILEEFVDASEGKPDYKFWQDMVRTRKPGEVRGAGCTRRSKKPTEFDGWFLNFFPFDENGRTPSKVDMYHQMLPEVVRAEFLYKIVNSEGEVLSEQPMEMVAGFVGYEEDKETYALTPVIGWMIGTYSKID